MKLNISQRFRLLVKIAAWLAVGVIIVQVVLLTLQKYEFKQIEKEMATDTLEVIPEPVMLFNIQIDSFEVVSSEVKSGQNLSDLLVGKGFDMRSVDEISKKTSAVFDVRKMKVKNPYYFFMSKKDPSKVEYFIYEIDKVEYMVCQLGDSVRVYKEKKPIITQVKSASGVITSSLWNAMTAQALDPSLAMELSDIYQWTIDFFDIKKGDQFKVIYEEDFVYGKSVGIGRVFAAQFTHAKEDYYAFRFTQNNEDSYFDEKGKALKTGFLKAPLKFNRISSKFTNSRYHPVLKIHRPHHGVDYAAPTGTPVFAIGSGTVIAKAYQASGGGNYVKIKHDATYTTSYMHLSKFGPGIANGVHVKQGQVIGYVGSTGLSSGPHLDYRVYMKGKAIDPLKMKSPPSDPIKDNLMAEYTLHRDSLMLKLQAED